MYTNTNAWLFQRRVKLTVFQFSEQHMTQHHKAVTLLVPGWIIVDHPCPPF